jgi:putative Mg2+ transporter-C (MgtC) family protein
MLSEWDEVLRLGLALVLGTAIGVERERGDRAAGMRTHALVCLGAALITVISAYGFTTFYGYSAVRMDPGRIAAQIVSGIGFLGAGTIIFRKEAVRGLTTAAGLWVVAGIGMAAGAGMYLLAVAGTAGSLVILVVLKRLERHYFPHRQTLTLRLHPQDGQLAQIRAVFRKSDVRLRSLVLQVGSADEEELIGLECIPSRVGAIDCVVERLRAVPGLVSIEAGRGLTVDDLNNAGEGGWHDGERGDDDR